MSDDAHTREPPDEPASPDTAAFDAVFDWAMRQDFTEDHAERVRREAWGRDDKRGKRP